MSVALLWMSLVLLQSLIKHPVIIWPMRIKSRLSPGYEVSFGRSLVRVGQLGAENICYLSHYPRWCTG